MVNLWLISLSPSSLGADVYNRVKGTKQSARFNFVGDYAQFLDWLAVDQIKSFNHLAN